LHSEPFCVLCCGAESSFADFNEEDKSLSLATCTGPCKLTFHFQCLELSEREIRNALKSRDTWKCPNCVDKMNICLICNRWGRRFDQSIPSDGGDDDSGSKGVKNPVVNAAADGDDEEEMVHQCSHGTSEDTPFPSCPRFYHLKCLSTAYPMSITRIYEGDTEKEVISISCPLHRCKECDEPINDEEHGKISCNQCPVAYHQDCLSLKNKAILWKVSNDQGVCGDHNELITKLFNSHCGTQVCGPRMSFPKLKLKKKKGSIY
jgi:hypothetical protein